MEDVWVLSQRWLIYISVVVALICLERWCHIVEQCLAAVIFSGAAAVLSRTPGSRVQASILRGKFALKTVNLQTAYVDSLDLPFLCKSASIGCIELSLPWCSDAPGALTAKVCDLAISATTRRHPQHCSPEAYERQQAHATSMQRTAKLRAVDNILWHRKPPWLFFVQMRAFVMRHVFYLVTRLLEVDLQSFSIAIVLDHSLPLDMDSHEGTQVATPLDGMGSTLSIHLSRLTIHNAGAGGYGVLSTDVKLKGFSVDIDTPPLSAPSGGKGQPGHRTSVVRRWNVAVTVGWRLASGLFDRLAQRTGSARAPHPVLRVEVFAHALLLHHNAASFRSFLGFQCTFLHFLRFASYYRLRPQVNVVTSPQNWWQHAGRIILQERLSILGPAEAKGRSLALLELEARLTDDEAALFRWWAWAKRKRRFDRLRAAVGEELHQGMVAVDAVLLAQGVVRQKRTRPLRAQLQLQCPKVAVVFEHSGVLHGAPPGVPGPQLVVSARQLHCTVLAGSHESQLQSGAGPLSLEASCSELHVTHGMSKASQTPSPSQSDASTASRSEASHQMLWLIKSPSSAASTAMSTSHDTAVPQVFLKLQYKQPPLQAVEPGRMHLTIAPIDAVYSQAVLLHASSFLNAAWPPPALDPLTLRTTVTLREIVTERLVGYGRMRQRHKPSLMQLQVSVGEVRLLLPCGEASSQDAQRRLTRTTTLGPHTAPARPPQGAPLGLGASHPPTMAVLVLGGFSACTAPPPSQRPALQPAASSRVSGTPDEPEEHRPANWGGVAPTPTSQHSVEWLHRLKAEPVTIPARPPSHLSASDWERKVPSTAFAEPGMQGGGGAVPLSRTSTIVKHAPSRKLDNATWLWRRPGVTHFEILQVNVTVQAFLARPTDLGLQTFGHCAQVLDTVSINTSIDRCAEPGPMGLYRHVVQIDVVTTEVHLEMSQYVKCELHSLFSYLHSNLLDEELASTFSRHFTKRDVTAARKSVALHGSHSHVTGTPAMEFGFEGKPSQGLRLDPRLSLAPGTVLAEGAIETADGSGVHAQELGRQRGAHNLQDIRFAIGAMSLEDLAPVARSPIILGPTPPCVDERCYGCRPTLQRFFQAWRRLVAQRSTRPRCARHSAQHLLLTTGAQLSGHLTIAEDATAAHVDSSFLCISVEDGAIGRLLQYMQAVTAAKPRPPLGSVRAKASDDVSPGDSPFAAAAYQEQAVPLTWQQKSDQATVGQPVQPQWLHKISLQTHILVIHADVIMEGRRFSTIILEGLGATFDVDADGLEQATSLQCSGIQVIDRTERRHSNDKLQAVARLEADNLVVTVVCRFLYDWLHFAAAVQEMLQSSSWGKRNNCDPEPQHYRPLLEVVLTNLQVDLPRSSFSTEVYTLQCGQVQLLLPVSAAELDTMRPCMDRSDHTGESGHLAGLSASRKASPASFERQSRGGLQTQSSCFHRHAGPTDRATGVSFQTKEDLLSHFYHWKDGCRVWTTVQMESVRLIWRQKVGRMAFRHSRQVWESSCMLIGLQDDMMHIQVWVPWANAILGEAQYQLCLAVLWENASEPGSFGPATPMWHPIGTPLPPQPPQPEVLGVDRSLAPTWEVEVNFSDLAFAMERLALPGSTPGTGPQLCKVRMRDIQILVATHPCGSMSVVLSTQGVRIQDTRHAPDSSHSSSNTDAAGSLVLAIGRPWPELSLHLPAEPAASSQTLSSTSTSSQRLWGSQRISAKRGMGSDEGPAYTDPASLASRSSFQWDPPTHAMPLPHRRMRSIRESQDSSADAEDCSSSWEPDANSDAHQLQTVEETAEDAMLGDGFFVEYVIQANARASEEEAVVWGPHVAECVMRGAQLQWPYAGDCSFLWDMMEVFSHYVLVPWVSPFPQLDSAVQWMYTNILLERSRIFFPLQSTGVGGGPRLEASMLGDLPAGLSCRWEQLRLGYFFGGDGECSLRFNAKGLAALGRLQTGHQQALSAPFSTAAEVQWRQPRALGAHWETAVAVSATQLKLQPAFAHVPLVHAGMGILQQFLLGSKQVAEVEEIPRLQASEGIIDGPTTPPGAFRGSSLRMNLGVDSATIVLVDDRFGNSIEVLAITAQAVKVEWGREILTAGQAETTFGEATLSLDVSFLNSALDATESLLESWPFAVKYNDTAAQRMLSLQSEARLNLIITPAAFRSLGDLHSFVHLITQVAQPNMSGAVRRSMGPWLTNKVNDQVSSLYRLVNRSGLRLSYWVDLEGGRDQSEVFSLNSWEESPLQVEPMEKAVILPHSQLQVLARTIHMQFQGNWTAVTDIIVDKVGKYAYTIGSPHDTAITPMVMDVTLDVRTKVLTVHSPFRIENCTNTPLEFVVHMFMGAGQAMSSMQSRAAASAQVPTSGPLLPGLQCYLPAPAIWGGVMYLRAVGWQMSMQDKINLEGPKLKEKQGLYTCAPEPVQQQALDSRGEAHDHASLTAQAFHCCLEVKEELIKMSMKEGNILQALPEYVLTFQPPLVIQNVLPYEIIVTLWDSASLKSEGSLPRIPIAVGASVEVYHFSMARKIRMELQMAVERQEYRSLRAVNIHYPPSQYLDDSARSSLFQDLPGLRLGRTIQLVKADASQDRLHAALGPRSNRLTLKIHNKMNAHSRARQVVIYSPYWIVNKTNLALQVQDYTMHPGSTAGTTVPEGLGDVAKPLPFSSSSGKMRMCVHTSSWSRAINLENLTMHQSIHVEGAGSSITTVSAQARAGADNRNIVRYDSGTIVPRSVSPKSRRNTSRVGSRLAHIHKSDSWEDVAHQAAPAEVATSGARPATAGDSVHAGPSPQRRHEFAIESGPGPSIFHRTKVVSVVSRFMLFNNSSEVLHYGQRGTSLVWQLPQSARYPFHWDDKDAPFQLCVRPGVGGWNWSGAFQIDSPGDFGLRVYNVHLRQHRILPIDVSNNGASIVVAVGKATLAPPYRVENRCEGLVLRFQQREVEEEWEAVQSGHTADYAWDEPLLARKLRVCIDSDLAAYQNVAVHEYSLDMIKAYPVIKLRRSNPNRMQKMASTMGRALTSGMTMASKGSLLTGTASQQNLHLPPASAQDQPELDARYVYVGVHADGPTRVLCFSDTRDQYTRGTNEEPIAYLQARLAHLEERIQGVNKELQAYHDRQGIDMALALSLRPHTMPGLTEPARRTPHNMFSGHARALSWSTLGDDRALDPLASLDSGEVAHLRELGLLDKESTSPGAAAVGRVSHMFRNSMSLVKDVRKMHLFRSGSDALEAGDQSAARASQDLPAWMAPSGAGGRVEGGSHHLAPLGEHGVRGPLAATSEAGALQAGPVSPRASGLRGTSRAPSRRLTWDHAPSLRQVSSPIPEIFGRPSMRVTDTHIMEDAVPPTHSSTDQSNQPKAHAAAGAQACDEGHGHSPRHLQAALAGSRKGLTRLKRFSTLTQHHKPSSSWSSNGDETPRTGQAPEEALSRSALSSVKPAGEILGGELVVTLQAAQGLVSAWSKRREQVHQASGQRPGSNAIMKQVRTFMGPHKGGVYCLLQCEGQTKRTGLSMGQQQPVWQEEVTFKAVQITSDLQVTVLGRGRLGSDVFLGEVVIALRELEEVSTDQPPDFRSYVLGRRSAKEKVSGEVRLACSWRITPVDVAHIKVKARQAELDRKQEVLALLLERYSPILDPSKTAHPAQESPLPLATDLSGSSSWHSIADAKRIQNLRGHLTIKVIEARNMRLPSDMLHAFFTMDAYTEATVSSGESGMPNTSRQTRVFRNSLTPSWNETLSFSDIPFIASLTLALYDHKKLTSDVYLGQAQLQVRDFSSGQPHYLWLPLHPPSLQRSSALALGLQATPKPEQAGARAPVAELHVRVQWSSEDLAQAHDTSPSLTAELALSGVGISVVDASSLRLPREVLHALLEDIRLDFRYSAAAQSSSFAIRSIQVDNQILTSSHPVVLAPSRRGQSSMPARRSRRKGRSAAGMQGLGQEPPFVEVRWEMLHHNPSILYFKSLSLVIQELDLVLEEDLLDLLALMLRDLPSEELWQRSSSHSDISGSQEAGTAGASMLLEVLDASMPATTRGAQGPGGRKWYFEKLDLQGIRCNLTLLPHGGAREAESGGAMAAATRYRMASTLGIHLTEINSVPLRVNALLMKNAFVTPRTLLSQLLRHLFLQALHETHKILGQVDILGSPIVLGSNIIAGLRQFITEPLKAENPKQFIIGVGYGSLALVKYGTFGCLLALEQLLGGMAKGLAVMTMDQEFINRFRVRPITYRQRLVQGLQGAGVGLYEGVTGVVRGPMTGWQEEGILGACLGVVTGSMGLVLKPVAGMLLFGAKGLGGIGAGVRAWGDEIVRTPHTRIRSPRQFAALAGDARPSEMAANFNHWRIMVAQVRKGRYAGEDVLDFLQSKDDKAVIITNKHIIYLDTHRHRIRWAFSLANLSSVSASGLVVLLHHQLTLQLGASQHFAPSLTVPVRKRVECRTRDLHQSLVVKLSRAISRAAGEQQEPTAVRSAQRSASFRLRRGYTLLLARQQDVPLAERMSVIWRLMGQM
ncbi:hypothetical protein WJX73_004442 [Symbiochloris irregularis]|uniref:C2 domain-containing protein n=1 Tax=Symbiochloris irregularis TaxID=706552 RepID=A0AAW1PNW1_9CHLO